jgi:hypothetical protein
MYLREMQQICCTFEVTDIACGNPTSKVRSQNAGHTTARSQLFSKIGYAF